MRFLIIGLGSMGKRRIRCLKSLDIDDIVGYDPRDDRRKDVQEKYNINVVKNLDQVDQTGINAFIICTPPDKHLEYLLNALYYDKPAFVEASVLLDGLENIMRKAREKNILIAPSCTLKFHPMIKDIKRIVNSEEYGRITSFSYHSGQFLPDWHPWENVKDYYVSKKETGGCREIVPFELTWIVDILGYPKQIIGLYGQTSDVGAPVDDTYALILEFEHCFGSLLVDITSQYAVRSLILNMEGGQIQWKWDEPYLRLYETSNKRWITFSQSEGDSAEGYNKNIIEGMYVDEMKSFIEAIKCKAIFPNTLEEDLSILKLLYTVENNLKES
ncbi:MAG: Gfo/Idh/MocA family protein [Vulcanimicrobiota bacterium]